MKTFNIWWPVMGIIAATTLGLNSCKKYEIVEASPHDGAISSTTSFLTGTVINSELISSSSPYVFSLDTIIHNGDGTYSWNYSAYNPNPGDGTNGTIPDLDYWDMTLGHYVIIDDIVTTAVSTDGITWTSSRPAYRIDTNQSCATDTVIQFNLGTRAGQRSYYSITVNGDYSINDSIRAIYVVDNGHTCGLFEFSGFGAPVVDGESCSFGPGKYFSKPDYVWSSNVSVGGYAYTQVEARAIYETPNRGGIRDSKYGFIFAVVIKMSESTISQTSPVWDDVRIIEDYLGRAGKLSPSNLPTGNEATKNAAERISRWLGLNN
jgi:hypothetical protein